MIQTRTYFSLFSYVATRWKETNGLSLIIIFFQINSCPMCRTEFPKESQGPVQFFHNNSEQSRHQNIQNGPSSPPLNMEFSGLFR